MSLRLRFRNAALLGAALAILSATTSAAGEWREFTSIDGRTLTAKVVAVRGDVATLELRNGRQYALEFEKLSEADREWLSNWEEDDMSPTGEPDSADGDSSPEGPLHKRLYPRNMEEIREGLDEILKRPVPDGIDSRAGEAINHLNAYRFLSGVSSDVVGDAEMNEQAKQAAEACDRHGSLSHDLGHFTDICNLDGQANVTKSVRGYINDPGENNREERGHRRWCLNPPMGKAGFGGGTKFSAMACMDGSGGGRMRDSWGYPGKGLYPISYLHGDGWSLYLTEAAPEKSKLEIEVFKLFARPESPFTWADKNPGTPIEVVYIGTYANAINFEPRISGKGIYWVRIRGGGVREQYLVELF